MGSDERPLRAAMGFGGHARQPHIVENPCIFSLQLERLAASSSCGAFTRAAGRFQSLWCLSEKSELAANYQTTSPAQITHTTSGTPNNNKNMGTENTNTETKRGSTRKQKYTFNKHTTNKKTTQHRKTTKGPTKSYRASSNPRLRQVSSTSEGVPSFIKLRSVCRVSSHTRHVLPSCVAVRKIPTFDELRRGPDPDLCQICQNPDVCEASCNPKFFAEV